MGTLPLPKARLEPPAVRAIGRERVDRLLDRARDVPLTVVVGPAGAGKTTAASHLVQRNQPAAVWYRAHPVDGRESTLCEHLAEAVTPSGGGRDATTADRAPTELPALFHSIERARAGRELLLVIDEFDAIIGTATETRIGELLADLGPSVHLVTLSRQRPSFNVTRLRLSASVCEIGPDVLRFRSWEVDRLFRELYGRPLLPDEVAELERKTGGWVAALQLFHLATTSLTAGERRAALTHVGRRDGPDWDFLADNVLSGLPDDLQLFLLETAPLERLTASLCDELLDQHSTGQQLAELERRQLITPSVDSPGSFRSHEVLRSHLDGLLMEWEGPDAVRKRYRRAAEVLEHHGQFAEALRAYCRGEDWGSAARLLGSRGEEVAARPGSWLVALPPSMVENDPWLLLALARHHRASGRLLDAIDTYQRVERQALTASPATMARRERMILATLLDRSGRPPVGWVAALRDAAVADPVVAVDGLGSAPHDLLARGVAELLAGDVRSARLTLRLAEDDEDASPPLSVAAATCLVVATHLGGSSQPPGGDDLEPAAAALEMPFLTRLSRAAAGLASGSVELVESVAEESEREGDMAGAAVAWVLAAIAAAWAPTPLVPNHPGRRARDLCQVQGLRTLELWALIAIALAERDHETAIAAETAARRGPAALQDLSRFAVVATTGDDAETSRRGAALSADHGLVVPASLLIPAESSEKIARDGPELRIQCFGRFEIGQGDTPIDLNGLRPRARAVLRMLAANVGSGVHRQTLYAEMWPGDDETAAARKLQVAISSIRRVMDADGLPDVVVRAGEVYLIDHEQGVVSDIERFDTAVCRARSLMADGAATDAEPELRRALELHTGELLPEDGTAEWVVIRRRELSVAATEAARSLAALLLDQHRAAEAVDVCRAGLAIDRYDDPLWRTLLTALDRDGDLAGHALARSDYDDVLAELGIDASDRAMSEGKRR